MERANNVWRRTVLIFPLLLISLISASSAVISGAVADKVVCEDNEVFEIKEKEIVASNIPAVTDDLIVIEAHRMRLTFYRNGTVIKSYPIAIGTPKTPSPIGEWKIIHKGGSWGGGFGARWLGLNVPWGIYGIHGTNKPGSIGGRTSHGCIRMFNHHVIELYKMTKLGTPVHIIGNIPKVKLRNEYRQKQSGQDIVFIQFALRKAGFDPGAADARFGELMVQAVKKLQSFYGLPTTGKLGINEQYLINLR